MLTIRLPPLILPRIITDCRRFVNPYFSQVDTRLYSVGKTHNFRIGRIRRTFTLNTQRRLTLLKCVDYN